MPEFTNDLTHDDLALLLLLAEKRSLTRSAMTLAWSTPKASHRLNHARALIGDELFVRSGNSLVPTKRMEALVPTMRRALKRSKGFSLKNDSRRWKLTVRSFSKWSTTPPPCFSRRRCPH